MENHGIEINGRRFEASVVPSNSRPQMVGKLLLLTDSTTGKVVWKHANF